MLEKDKAVKIVRKPENARKAGRLVKAMDGKLSETGRSPALQGCRGKLCRGPHPPVSPLAFLVQGTRRC